MPDNNVAETARSPANLACLSVRLHRNDVTPRVHVCRVGMQEKSATQGRELAAALPPSDL